MGILCLSLLGLTMPYNCFRQARNNTWLRYILPILLTLSAALYYSKDVYFFHNGLGGTSWKIGAPKVNLISANSLCSLPEIRSFALELVNRDRSLNGLTTLVEDPLLSEAAQRHAQDMLDRRYFAHVSPEGKTPTNRFHEVGGNPRVGVGENIMYGQDSFVVGLTYGLAEQYQKQWMYSPGHRENLLRPHYTRFGYGIVTGPNGRQYAVQEFAGPDS